MIIIMSKMWMFENDRNKHNEFLSLGKAFVVVKRAGQPRQLLWCELTIYVDTNIYVWVNRLTAKKIILLVLFVLLKSKISSKQTCRKTLIIITF